ncbi:hypothetical protein N752_23315 [Desulforamulus aquiferis]|nr:hypothetical protein N752_23315 [Desulforamulus aquiferis]
MIYDLMSKYSNVPSADLVCCIFQLAHSDYLGIVKLNYKPSFIHYVLQEETGRVNNIVKQKTSLPNEGQKVEECIFINLDDFSIKIIEKKYEIDGEKRFYLSSDLLECTEDLSAKEKIKILEKAVEDTIIKYYGENELARKAEYKRIVNENIEDEKK